MCNNCKCENYDQCSIVGFLPIGFCCSKCTLWDPQLICLKNKTKPELDVTAVLKDSANQIQPISTSIEGGLLKVVIKKEGKEVPLYIDIQKQLES